MMFLLGLGVGVVAGPFLWEGVKWAKAKYATKDTGTPPNK